MTKHTTYTLLLTIAYDDGAGPADVLQVARDPLSVLHPYFVWGDSEAATLDGARWRDTRTALDPREHAGEVIDMVACAVSWGEDTGLIARHPQHRYLVRLTREVLA